MKKIYLLTLFFFSALIVNAQSLPLYESFNYPVDSLLQNQSGFTAMNGGDDIIIKSGNLDYPGLPSSTGNMINFEANGKDYTKQIDSIGFGSTVYYSFLMRINNINGLTDANGGYFAALTEDGSNFGATVWLKKNDSLSFYVGNELRTSTQTNQIQWTSTSFAIDSTYLVVGSYTLNSGTNNDVTKLWINPTLGLTTEPVALISDSATSMRDLNFIKNFLIRQDNATKTPNIDFDELRIGTTWADVTPSATASINDNKIEGLNIYPNPATDIVTISSNNNGVKSVQLFDLTGKKVMSVETENTINVSGLTKGMYIIKITEAGKSATSKLIIK